VKQKFRKQALIGANFRLFQESEAGQEWPVTEAGLWGIPVPCLQHKHTGEYLLTEGLIENYIGLVVQHGPEVWHRWEIEQLVPEQQKPHAEE